jgi:hypothetical protein
MHGNYYQVFKMSYSTHVNLYLSTNLISALASLDMYDFPHS